MVKLTAKRPILYQGRMYEPGDTLPAHDGRMVSAWLEAESAEWTGEEPATTAAEATDPAGTPEGTQGTGTDPEATQGTQEGQGGTQGTEGMVEGHLAGEDLEAMKKDDLERLANDLGVKLPRGATKAMIVKLLTEAPVQASAGGGGAR